MTVGTGKLRSWPGMAAVLIAMAVILVVNVRHAQRQPWADEAWVIEYINQSTYVEALGLAMYEREGTQGSPRVARDRSEASGQAVYERKPVSPGFLALMRSVCGHTYGSPVWQYRATIAVFGLAMVLVVGRMAGRWSGWITLGVAASLLLVGAPILQRHMTEINQHFPAAVLSICLIAACDAWLRSGKRSHAYIWFGLGLASALMTFVGVFAIVGTGMTLLLFFLVRKDWRQLTRAVVLGTGVMTIAALVYFAFSRNLASGIAINPLGGQSVLWQIVLSPLNVWETGVDFFTQSWYRYERMPVRAMFVFALVGWCLWCWHERTSAIAAASVVAVTLLAIAMNVWPVGIRANLPLVMIAHMALIAGPLVVVGRMLHLTKPHHGILPSDSKAAAAARAHGERTPAPAAVAPVGTVGRQVATEWVGVIVCVMMTMGVLWENRSANYEVAAVGELLAEVKRIATDTDLVLLDPTADVNYRLSRFILPGVVRSAPWPDQNTVETQYMPLVGAWHKGRVYIAAGHHNEPLRATWAQLGTHLQRYGAFEMVWTRQDKFVAIYEYVPYTPIPDDTLDDLPIHPPSPPVIEHDLPGM